MSDSPIYDVFLSHSAQDAGLAAMVSREFEKAGCGVFSQATLMSISVGDNFHHRIIDALVDSSAVVMLLTRSSVESRWFAFEVGAAMAWDKPVFVLHDGVEVRAIPEFLAQYQIIPLTNLELVVQQVKLLRHPLTETQRESLMSVYRELGIPVDQLLLDTKQRRKLHGLFAGQQREVVSENRLLQELIRLRKQGRLPKQRKFNEPVSAS